MGQSLIRTKNIGFCRLRKRYSVNVEAAQLPTGRLLVTTVEAMVDRQFIYTASRSLPQDRRDDDAMVSVL